MASANRPEPGLMLPPPLPTTPKRKRDGRLITYDANYRGRNVARGFYRAPEHVFGVLKWDWFDQWSHDRKAVRAHQKRRAQKRRKVSAGKSEDVLARMGPAQRQRVADDALISEYEWKQKSMLLGLERSRELVREEGGLMEQLSIRIKKHLGQSMEEAERWTGEGETFPSFQHWERRPGMARKADNLLADYSSAFKEWSTRIQGGGKKEWYRTMWVAKTPSEPHTPDTSDTDNKMHPHLPKTSAEWRQRKKAKAIEETETVPLEQWNQQVKAVGQFFEETELQAMDRWRRKVAKTLHGIPQRLLTVSEIAQLEPCQLLFVLREQGTERRDAFRFVRQYQKCVESQEHCHVGGQGFISDMAEKGWGVDDTGAAVEAESRQQKLNRWNCVGLNQQETEELESRLQELPRKDQADMEMAGVRESHCSKENEDIKMDELDKEILQLAERNDERVI